MKHAQSFCCDLVWSIQAAQDRQARGVKRSADVILKDEEDRRYDERAGAGQQPALSGLTESLTADGNDDGPLADEDDMEEEVVGESVPLLLHCFCCSSAYMLIV